MNFRVTSWKHVVAYGTTATALAVLVPRIALGFLLEPLPLLLKAPVFHVISVLAFCVALPISFMALHLLKRMNTTMDTLDAALKIEPMTGLYCRNWFMQKCVERDVRGGFLAIVDADHFKLINDTYGHAAGDAALKHIARSIQQSISGHGFAGRIGGEEFAVYLPRATVEQAKLLMESLGTWLRHNRPHFQGQDIVATVSIGLIADDGSLPFETAMRFADEALYRAKTAGRDRCVVHDQSVTMLRAVA